MSFSRLIVLPALALLACAAGAGAGRAARSASAAAANRQGRQGRQGADRAEAGDQRRRGGAPRQRVVRQRASLITADFVQIGPDGHRAEGKLYVERPGRLRFQFAPPDRLEIVADGRSVAVRDQKMDTQDLYLIGQTPLKFLLKDRSIWPRTPRCSASRSMTTRCRSPSRTRRRSAVRRASNCCSTPTSFALKQWTVDDAQGYQTVVTLFNIDLTSQPDESLFKIDEQRMIGDQALAIATGCRRRCRSVPPASPDNASAAGAAMRFTLATWNINSVRLRIGLVARYLREQQPDVLCLQETKCRDAEFPSAEFHRLGYEHIAINGQKGYHGVAIVSRLPILASPSANSAARAIRATCM